MPSRRLRKGRRRGRSRAPFLALDIVSGEVLYTADALAGRPTLHVESLTEDGTLTATFDEVRLSGAAASTRILSHGTVSARITRP